MTSTVDERDEVPDELYVLASDALFFAMMAAIIAALAGL